MSKRKKIPGNIEAIYKLTPLQEGFLFHELKDPGAGNYLQQFCCRFHGSLHVKAFQTAWEKVVARHEPLRASFFWQKLTHPQQVIHQKVTLPWRREDWRSHGEEQTRSELDGYLQKDRAHCFKLQKAPLMRFSLFHLRDDTYQFVWTFHHILFDGWSLQVIIHEVLTHYEAQLSFQTIELPPPPSMGRYMAWLQSRDLAKARAYWQHYLRGMEPPKPLTFIDYEEGGLTGQGKIKELSWPLQKSLSESLRVFARRHHLTVNILFQGALARLLRCYSGQDDIIFGVTVSGRPADFTRMESMVGLLINTLPARVRFPRKQNMVEWLHQLQRDQVSRDEHAYTPLGKIREWTALPNEKPLFECLFLFENYAADTEQEEWGPESVVRDIKNLEQPHYPLSVSAKKGDANIFQVHYDSSRFNTTTVLRMKKHLGVLLAKLAEGRMETLADWTILSEAERHQMLCQWNDSPGEPSSREASGTVSQWLAKVMGRRPDSVAVQGTGVNPSFMTYEGLEQAGSSLAHNLRQFGVRPGVAVGCFFHPGPDLLVGLWALFKIGAIFLPLDPKNPNQRLIAMFQQAGSPLLLTVRGLAARAPKIVGPTWFVDEVRPLANRGGAALPPTDPRHLAYICFTSGSTGKPKGVCIPYSALSLYLRAAISHYGLTPEDRVYSLAPAGFDVFFEETLPVLVTGGCVIYRSNPQLLESEKLQNALALYRATGLELSTAQWIHWISMLTGLGLKPPSSLRFLIVSCEKLRREHVLTWREFGVPLFHVYGVTETTISNTFTEIASGKAVPKPRREWSMGYPFPQNQIYVLDDGLQPQPMGVVGELFLAGGLLARGYLQADLTAERFIPNPLAAAPGGRLYRTGDAAFYLENGELEFAGRTDRQINLRGYRIEPGEIEFILKSHPHIHAAIVRLEDLGQDGSGRKRHHGLIAYLVPKSGRTLDIPALKQHLRERLAAYMVPSAFTVLAKLPLTDHGKVDVRALNRNPRGEQTTHFQSMNAIQEILAGIWCEVLDRESVGITEDFFELGGHSLLAVQIISRIRVDLGIEAPIRAIFDQPTIAGLAEELVSLKFDHTRPTPIKAVPRDRNLPLSFAQQRQWILYRLEGVSATYNVPMNLEMRGNLDVVALERSFAVLINRHEVLRTGLGEEGGIPFQRIYPESYWSLPYVDLQNIRNGQIQLARLAATHAGMGFYLDRVPLWKMMLVRISRRRHGFLLNMDHIISDGWSTDVAVAEIAHCYGSYLAKREPGLKPLPLQYGDFAYWQRQWMGSPLWETQLAYWRKQLAGAPPLLELPTDFPRPEVVSYRGGEVGLFLGAPFKESLRALSREYKVTPFMFLLTVWKLLLMQYSLARDIVVGSPIANRNRSELEPLIGFFLNTQVYRTRIREEDTFDRLLRNLREQALGAHAHQDIPFEFLVDELQPERSLSHHPIFQVMFVFEKASVKQVQPMTGLRLSALGGGSPMAKFDLTLAVTESAEGLLLRLNYRRDLWHDTTVRRMADHYVQLLERVGERARRPVGSFSLLSPAEHHHLLSEWNDNHQIETPSRGVYYFIERVASRKPDGCALSIEDGSHHGHVSFGYLDSLANRVAGALREKGVGPEITVGLLMERSLELVIAMVGILKAGGVYLPIDPDLPQERIQYILADAGARCLLTSSPWISSQQSENLLDIGVLLKRNATAVVCCPILTNPAQAAYLIYTSGSTGKPKGTLISHRAIVQRLAWISRIHGFTRAERVLQKTPIGFDVSLWELWWPLCYGAHMAVALPGGHLSPHYLTGIIRKQMITSIHFVPSMLRVFMEGPYLSRCNCLKRVICSGEELTADLQNRFFTQSTAELYNLYGPTEAAIDVSVYKCRPQPEALRVPIGRSVPGAVLYVVDRSLYPTPIGVVGELLIGGPLARGYTRLPQLTSPVFVPDSLGPGIGQRLYRTGDLARFDPDGNILFLGRRDHQVKLRGFRIELGETEMVLRQHPAIANAAVTVQGSDPFRHLAAFVEPAAGQDGAELRDEGEMGIMQGSFTESLRNYLLKELPEYSVPTHYLVLNKLPLTPNGKIDRQGLPVIADMQKKGYIAPRTELEERMTEIWSELLDKAKIGIADNFFELGGNSVAGTILMSRIQDAFGLELPLRTLFIHPTLEALTNQVSSLSALNEMSEAQTDREMDYETLEF